jgi:hypothetical protein
MGASSGSDARQVSTVIGAVASKAHGGGPSNMPARSPRRCVAARGESRPRATLHGSPTSAGSVPGSTSAATTAASGRDRGGRGGVEERRVERGCSMGTSRAEVVSAREASSRAGRRGRWRQLAVGHVAGVEAPGHAGTECHDLPPTARATGPPLGVPGTWRGGPPHRPDGEGLGQRGLACPMTPVSTALGLVAARRRTPTTGRNANAARRGVVADGTRDRAAGR